MRNRYIISESNILTLIHSLFQKNIPLLIGPLASQQCLHLAATITTAFAKVVDRFLGASGPSGRGRASCCFCFCHGISLRYRRYGQTSVRSRRTTARQLCPQSECLHVLKTAGRTAQTSAASEPRARPAAGFQTPNRIRKSSKRRNQRQ